MASNLLGLMVGRLAAAAGLAVALSACSLALEEPARAMYGTTAWSDAWQTTCGDVDPAVKPERLSYEHLNHDCAQYEVAQRMRNHQPAVAGNAKP